MKSCVFSIFFILICIFPFNIFAQSKKSITQLPPVKAEPFKIEPGSSFSASVPKDNRTLESAEFASQARQSIITQDFSDALELIRSNYVDGKRLDLNELTKSTLTGMLHSLDPHSNYFDAKDYRELLNDEQSEYIGIGASIANYTKNGITETYITAAFPDSPALRAGLRFGDKIISVSGENMSGKDSFYVREKIRGAKGTVARLTVERANSGKVETIEIKRGVVPQPSLPDTYLLRPGIGYIDLTRGFTYTTSAELDAALKDLHEQGINSLILDLRDNPGGILDQAVKVAERFLPPGQIVVTQRGRTEIDNRTWKSNYKNPEFVSLVVLVNDGSASASEIVTGALQDYDRALVVGEKTFGKGLVQSVINLPYGSGLTLTTARYYTPSGRSIQRDYSNGNLYDYFQHKVNYTESNNLAKISKTLTGRTVYGGDGITPDENIKPEILDSAQIKLLDPLFFFSIEAVNGRIQRLENFKIKSPVQYGHRIQTSDFPAGNELFTAFKSYLQKTGENFTDEQLEANQKFILLRLRFNLATAAFGSVAANQVLIENDVQVAKAVETLPRAQTLALTAKKSYQKK